MQAEKAKTICQIAKVVLLRSPSTQLAKIRVQKWKRMKLLSVLGNLQEYPMKWQSLESSKTELISTCIQVFKEPSNAQEGVTQCHFSKYVSETLASFDRRTRLIAENRISDILFELEMNDQSHQITGQSHFTHSPSGASGFMSMLQDSQHYR